MIMLKGLTASKPATEDWFGTEPWVRFGTRTVLGLLGGLFLFLALVSISGAVVTAGNVTVRGNYKTVQHLDGGIVSKIYVQNGDLVKAGDVLLKLEDTQTNASLAVTTGRVNDYLIQQARLEAERDGRDTFQLPEGLDATDPVIAKIAAAQTSLFDARRSAHNGQKSVLKQRLAQLGDDTRGLAAQLSSAKKQSDINKKELASVLPLFDKGFVNQQRVSPLQRESARLEGEVGRLTSEQAKIKSAIGETELRVAQLEKEYVTQVVDELRKVQAGLAEQLETQRATADRSVRTTIVAPVSGFVHNLSVHTEGGVITAATPILQIIPENETLIIEAQLAPQDIDKVHRGQQAMIRFPAFSSKSTPTIYGSVLKVSPAQITDNQNRTFFTTQIEITPEELAKIGQEHRLVPGMPAEVYIETASRSMLSYLLKPLTDAMTRAFRES
jgi:HlyD family secretion protein